MSTGRVGDDEQRSKKSCPSTRFFKSVERSGYSSFLPDCSNCRHRSRPNGCCLTHCACAWPWCSTLRSLTAHSEHQRCPPPVSSKARTRYRSQPLSPLSGVMASLRSLKVAVSIALGKTRKRRRGLCFRCAGLVAIAVTRNFGFCRGPSRLSLHQSSHLTRSMFCFIRTD